MRIALFLLSAAIALPQTPELEQFEKNIRPLFASNCYACHGAKMQMGGLNLSSSGGLSKAASAGVIVRNDADGSRIMEALNYAGKVKMPPSGKLSGEQISAVKDWIAGGAHWPEAAETAKAEQPQVVAKHWSFQPLTKPAVPVVKNADWAVNSIDRFILAKLEEKGVAPAAQADRLTLLRRVTFDLTGLPPTLAEIRSYLADKKPDAYAKVVDRLLASPRYGERWGRHWLDVARYADSTGMDEDNPYPHAWRFRDYVIHSFNNDVPYDRFIKEQLAGDLLPAKDDAERAKNLVATGFLALGPKPLAQQDRVQMIYDVVDEQIDATSKAFLGLTVACARCHDHKFDPILTKDYYGLASIFASTTAFRDQGRPGSISYMYYAPLDQAEYGRYMTHRARALAKRMEMEDALSEALGRENATLRPKLAGYLQAAWKVINKSAEPSAAAEAHGVEAKMLARWVKWLSAVDDKARAGYLKKFFEATGETIAPVASEYQDAYSKSAAKWDEQLDKWRTRFAKDALHDRALPERPKFDAEQDPFFAAAAFETGPFHLPESARVELLRAEWKQLEDSMPPVPALASAVTDGVDVRQHVFLRGDHHNQGDPVGKHFPVFLAGTEQKPIEKGSGRLQLAEWLTKPDNPLTVRVMVNRIWLWHFGEGLMRTPNNWGKTGEKPTHPELLDYLAGQFMESGWSVKAMHRSILLSKTYQMSSHASESAREADPGNRLWSRFSRIRMSVEEIRDGLLSLDGSLDLAVGGSLLKPEDKKRAKIDLEEVKRRTVYVPVRRGSIPSLLATFDFGDATTPSEGRARTNVAPQALFIRNSRFVVDRAHGLAEKLLAEREATDAQRVSQAYLLILGREPDAAETDAALTYIGGLEKRLGSTDAHQEAWQSLCHVLMSTNEFLYIN